ncbi:hypothetical protein D3C73_1278820 [compost metagenome]
MAATARRTLRSSATSTVSGRNWPSSFAPTASSNASPSRDVAATLCPRSSSIRTNARPRPVDAPVTNQIFSDFMRFPSLACRACGLRQDAWRPARDNAFHDENIDPKPGRDIKNRARARTGSFLLETCLFLR